MSIVLYTSYFGLFRTHPFGVSIAGYAPEGWQGRTYTKLAPKRWIYDKYKEDGNVAMYALRYATHVLSKLDRKQVALELGWGSILLCYEEPWQFCHRQLVAEWLSENRDITVRELRCPLLKSKEYLHA